MIIFKRIEWSEVSHLHKPRNVIVIIIEIVSLIPIDAIYYQVALKKYVATINYLRLRYVLRLVRLIWDKMEPRAMTKRDTLLKLTVNFMLMVSLTAATITFIAHPYTCLINTELSNCSNTYSYYMNYYVAIERITGKGFGEVDHHRNYRNTLTYIAMTTISFLAYFIIGYSTSKMICNMISRDAITFAFLLKVSTICRAILEWKYRNKHNWKNYHESLYNTCYRYFAIIWLKRKCSQSRTLVEGVIPSIMYKEIYLDMSWNALKHSHLFREEETHFLRKVSELVKHKFYAPGEIIFRQQASKSSMIFVTTGTIEVLSKENGEAPIMLLTSGTCLGESSLVISYPSVWTVACKTYCELEVLEKRDFMKLCAIYPQTYRDITKRVRKRYKDAKRLHDILQYQWKKNKIGNPEIVTMMFMKRTLHRLMKSRHKVEDVCVEWDESCGFQLEYFNMYAISEELERETDSIFLRKQFPFIFQPSSVFINGWQISIAIFGMLLALLYPVYLYYCGSIGESTHSMIYASVTILWCVDVYIQISTAVKTKNYSYTTVSSITYYRLSKLTFLIDIVTTLPFGWILLVTKGGVRYQTFLLAEIHKLLKAYKIKYIFTKLEGLNIFNTIFLRYVKGVMVSFFLFYYTGMVFYCLVCDSRIGCSSIYLRQLQLQTNLNVTRKTNVIIHLYALASLFIADITYFDFIKVISDFQIVFIIVVQLIYTFTNISILAYMAIMETLKEKENHRFKEFVNSMDNMAKDFKVSVVNQKRIQFYLKNNYWVDRGIMVLNPTLFPDNLSANLFTLYRNVLYGKFLHNIPFFAELEEKIIIEAVRFLKVTNFPSGEVITHAGEVCKEIHVIEFGYCTMKSKVPKLLKRTDSFCVIETCLQIPTFYTVVTITDCSVLSLDYNAYSQIANKYPEFRTLINNTLEDSVTASDVQRISEDNENCIDEEFVFETDTKDISFRHFIYGKDMRLLKKTQFEIEFTSGKQLIKYFLLRYTFTAYGRFLLIWESFRFLLAMTTNITASFTKLCSNCDTFYILLVLDMTAWIDIYIRHHVCYFNNFGVEVSHPMRTAIHYWKNGFLMDLLGALPMDYFVEDRSKMYFRINRVLQLHRPFGFVKYINDNYTTRSRLFEICKYMPITVLLVNYVSAINMYMTCDIFSEGLNVNYSCAATNWRDDYIYESASGSKRVKTHTAALLLTTTSLALIGFTEVSIEHRLELCTVSLMILIGHIFFIWITARMVADNFFKKSDLTSYQEAMKQLLKFVNYRKVDKNIKKEIIHYFEFMWLKTKGQELLCLLHSFNTAIKEDILFDMFGRTMQQSTIFSIAGKSFFKSLLLEAKYEVYINRGIIYRVNDIHGYLFFILKGNVEVLGPDYNKLTVLPAGSIFGNLDNCPLSRQTLMMVAKGNVELLRFSSTFFHAVLSKYRTILSTFQYLTAINVDYLENWSVPEEIIREDDSLLRIETVEKKYKPSVQFLLRLHLKLSRVFKETIYLQVWNIFVLVLACYIGFFLIMLHVALPRPSLSGLIFVYVIDVIYLIKIYLEFHTIYKNEFGTPVRSRRLIARNYLKKPIGFYLDLISSIPTEIICLAMLQESFAWVVWGRVRINRSIRIVHVFSTAKANKEKLHVNIIVMRVFYIICWISIILQVLTVLLYLFMEADQIGNKNVDWDALDNYSKEELLGQAYMIIVAASTGTALIGQKVKFTTYSTICVVFITLTFRFLITIFIGETAATLEAINQSKSAYKQFAFAIKQYMIREDISIPLRKRVGQYINLLWIYHRGVQLPSLLGEAPYYLREAILNAMFGFHIRRHRLLSNFHVDLIRQMAAELNVLVFFPGNYVVYEGDIDQCMYFIHCGEVEVIEEDTLRTEVVTELLTTGDVFGLRQGLFGDVGHPYTYKVSKYTIIVALKRSRWIRLLQFFPASMSIIASIPKVNMGN